MATFRAILSRGVFPIAIFGMSFACLGATFVPSGPSFQLSPEWVRINSVMASKAVLGPREKAPASLRDAAISRLGELVLTHRVIAVSA